MERVLGWWRFLAVYLLAARSAVRSRSTSARDHINAVAGASGAIYGLFAAALVLARRLGLDLRALVAVVAVNFLFTFTMSGISVEGHIGGFVLGGLATLGVIGWPTRQSLLDVRVQVIALLSLAVALVLLIWYRHSDLPGLSQPLPARAERLDRARDVARVDAPQRPLAQQDQPLIALDPGVDHDLDVTLDFQSAAGDAETGPLIDADGDDVGPRQAD